MKKGSKNLNQLNLYCKYFLLRIKIQFYQANPLEISLLL